MKFAAHYVFIGQGPFLPKAWVEVDAAGTVARIMQPEGDFCELAGMEFHSGIICAAFPPLFQHLNLNELLMRLPELKPFVADCPADTTGPKAVFNWVKAIQVRKPEVSLEFLLELFGPKAAAILNNDHPGKIEAGRRPGLVLLTGIDYRQLRLTGNSRLMKLI